LNGSTLRAGQTSREKEDTMRLVGIEEHVNRANVMERMTYLPEALSLDPPAK
jgi:hypothetical protein